jgi:hypothetical protein
MARKRAPIATLEDVPFDIMFGLNLEELLASAVLIVFIPLLMFGAHLPTPIWLVLMVSFPLWAILLFFTPRRDKQTMADWLTQLLPYWARQKNFYSRRADARDTPLLERIDASVSAGPNLVYWEFIKGVDGVLEAHVYEDPRQPYRFLIEREAHDNEVRETSLETGVALPLAARRPPPVELPL